MSFKSMISNLMSSFSKYGKDIKSTVNRFSMPRISFLNTLLHSRYFLYFIVFITFLTICAHAITGDYITIIIFSIIAFLTSFFNKNMIVILSVALTISIVLTNTVMKKYKFLQQHHSVEGFDGKDNNDDEEEYDKKKEAGKNDKDSETKKKEPDTKKKGADTKKKLPKGDTDEKKKDLQLLKNDYDEFKGIQDKIMEGIQDINKELDKAEKFVNKYEEYKNKHSA